MTTCPNCGNPARNDGSDFSNVCTRWPRCTTLVTIPDVIGRRLATRPDSPVVSTKFLGLRPGTIATLADGTTAPIHGSRAVVIVD